MRVRMTIAIAIALWALGSGSALGRYALQGDPEIAAWFHGLMNPRTGLSCCDESDGHILVQGDWRTIGDRYEVRIEDAWVSVPPGAVLTRMANPTGSAVVFYDARTKRIYCFVRAPEA